MLRYLRSQRNIIAVGEYGTVKPLGTIYTTEDAVPDDLGRAVVPADGGVVPNCAMPDSLSAAWQGIPKWTESSNWQFGSRDSQTNALPFVK